MSITALPAYPSTRTRESLSPSQQAKLNQTISISLSQTLTLQPDKFDTQRAIAFVSSYAKDAAQRILQALIWDDQSGPTHFYHKLSQVERSIHQRVFQLAEKLAPSLDIQVLLDLSVAYGGTNPARTRALFASAVAPNGSSLISQMTSQAVPAFETLLSAPSQGLYALRKTSHILLSLLRPAPPALIRPFSHSRSFILALARAYDHGLSTLAQSYGGLRTMQSPNSNGPSHLDEWERLFLETKVALIDSFHIILRTLLDDVAAIPSAGPDLAAQCERAFDIVFALLDLTPSRQSSSAVGTSTPFLDQTLLADYQHAYDLSRTLADVLRKADDARTELLESTLRSLESPGNEEGATVEKRKGNPGALRLLIRSSGVPPGVDNLGRGTTRAGADVKGKAKAVAVDAGVRPGDDPALDAAVSQVLDILPEQPPDYVRYLLSHPDYPYRGNAERLIEALLERTAPAVDEITTAIEQASTADVVAVPERQDHKNVNSSFVYTKERRNIFDEEQMDLAQIRVGKKSDDASTVLRDRTFIARMKADILRRVEEASDSEDEDGGPADVSDRAKGKGKDVAFEEELDEVGNVKVRDGEESEESESDEESDEEVAHDTEVSTSKPETVLELAYLRDPKLFDRDAQTRRSKQRAELRTQTGWTDEQIEGWRIMLERNPKKDKILQKHEFSGNKPEIAPGARSTPPPSYSGRGRGGRGRGGGGRGHGRGGGGGGSGEGGSAQDKAWKDRHKASRGNHNRKRGHDKKMARAGGPS